MQYRCTSKYQPMAPTKVRRVIHDLTGRRVSDVLDLLSAVHNRAADVVVKAIKSAAANAAEAGERQPGDLRIVEIVADQGPARKTIRAKSRGMAYVERARTCHVRVVLQDRSQKP